MERTRFSRLIGIIYVVGSVFGLFLSVGGLIVLWANKANVNQQVTDTAVLVGRSLTATQRTITITSETLQRAATDLDSLQKMIRDMTTTMENSSGMVRRTSTLVGTDIVGFINNTQTSLASMQNTAGTVDNMLRTITSIPLLGPWLGKGYNPQVTLQASVANVSRSLQPMPDSLAKISRDLEVSAANVDTIKAETAALSSQIAAIRTSLIDAQTVADEYQRILFDLQARYQKFQTQLPFTINTIYLTLSAVLLWMLFTQIGLLIHGIELMG